jgi:hypothetical protein
VAEVDTITWTGQSGTKYKYWIYPLGTALAAKPGNYIFARSGPQGWYAVYIGETGDLSTRFLNHHQEDCIKKYGATHIHAHVTEGGAQVRRDEETDIRRRWPSNCNEQ